MFARRLPTVAVSIMLSLLMFSPAFAWAATAPQVDSDSSDGCTGTWSLPPLFVGGPDGAVFAQAAYEFDKNCEPVLVSQIRLPFVPDSVLQPDQKPVETETVHINPPPPPYKGGSVIDAVDTCHLRTWEEDGPGLDMIAVQVDQTYSWNGSTVTLK